MNRETSNPDHVVQLLGIQTEEINPDRVVMKMPVDARHHQPFGILHGGVSVLLAETAASYGAWLNCVQENEITVGLEINANHIRFKREGMVTAVATPFHKGRSTMVWEVRITDEEERLICISRCTMAVVPKQKEK